jgi:subtilisin family serine protease
VVDVFYYFPTLRSSSQLTLIQITDPTPGIWIVTVYGEIILEGTYQTWLPLTGMGNPSVKFVYADSYRTVTEPSVTLGVITVGAYSSDEQKRYPESSWGPTNLPSLAPDFVAPGENVTGWFPSGAGMMSGTSVSAAIAAGAAALLLEWGIVRQHNKLMNTNQIRSYIIQGCAQDSERTYPNEQWGYGRMNIFNSFMLMQ